MDAELSTPAPGHRVCLTSNFDLGTRHSADLLRATVRELVTLLPTQHRTAAWIKGTRVFLQILTSGASVTAAAHAMHQALWALEGVREVASCPATLQHAGPARAASTLTRRPVCIGDVHRFLGLFLHGDPDRPAGPLPRPITTMPPRTPTGRDAEAG